MSLIQKAKERLAEEQRQKNEEMVKEHAAYIVRRDEASEILVKRLESLGCEDEFSYNVDHTHFVMARNGVIIARGWVVYEESRDHDGDGYSWGTGSFYLKESYSFVEKDSIVATYCSIEKFAEALVERFNL